MNPWNACGSDAEGLLALGAVKMDMPVFQQTIVGVGAGLVLDGAAAVFKSMNYMVLFKQGKGAGNRRLVDGFQFGFQIKQRQRIAV